jgi:hypothetical protein
VVTAASTTVPGNAKEMNFSFEGFYFKAFNCPNNCLTCGDVSASETKAGGCSTCLSNYASEGKTCQCRYSATDANSKTETLKYSRLVPDVATSYITGTTHVMEHQCYLTTD